MHKFFVPKNNIEGNKAIIDGEDVKHIYKVLRLKIGDVVSVNNSEGKEYIGEITLIDKSSVEINLIEENSINAAMHIWTHLKDIVSEAERNSFFRNIQKYKLGKIPVSTIKNGLWKLANKYRKANLFDSYYFFL